MDKTQFADTLRRLGLDQAEVARLLGYNKTSVYRWIRGAATVPPCVERVLWACERWPELKAHLLDGGDDRLRTEIQAVAMWCYDAPQQDVKL